MSAAANLAPPDVQHGAGHTRYRPDIDGLRSIAVLGVVLYHFGVPGFGGGYVGVDIFFVISGFLIGRSIISDMRAGTYSLLGFYERRIRRLYPAFFLVAAVSIPVFHFLLLPPDLREFGRSLFAAVLYASNVAFYWKSGYFDAAAIDKPLLHTWSLSVEEQFYLVFPLLVYVTVRWRASALRAVIGVAAIISFVAAQWMLSRDASAVFYLFPYRAWELLVGVGLTLLVDRPLPRRVERLREPVALAGMAMILLPIFLYGRDTPFPALAAAPPCLGAALLILAGSQGTSLATRMLAMRAPVFVGLVSYSFYLWHWPLLVALSYYEAGPLGPGLAAAGVAASFALAILSWRFVERPWRRPGFLGRKALFAWAAGGSAALAAIGLVYYRTDGLPRRFTGANAALVYAADDFNQTGGTCFPAENPAHPGLAYCQLGTPDALPTFLVWGDSHARAYRDGIDLAAREQGKAGLLVWSGGCPPLLGVGKRESFDSGAENPACRRQNDQVPDLIQHTGTLESVILIGRWAYYTEGTGVGRDVRNRIALIGPDGQRASSKDGQRRMFADRFVATVDRLRGLGQKVFVLEQTPEIPNSDASILARGIVSRRISREDAVRMTEAPRAAIEDRQAAAQTVLARLAAQGKVRILPTHDFFCGREACSDWTGSAPALFDNNHVTVTTSLAMRNRFLPAIGERSTAF